MFCSDVSSPIFYLFSSAVPHLLYYSHFPSMAVALLFGIFVFVKNKNSLSAKFLLSIAIVFFLWSLADIITWTNIDSRVVMLAWASMFIMEAFIFLLMFLFAVSFVELKGNILKKPSIIGAVLIFLSLTIAIPFNYGVSAFDLANCEAKQNNLIYYLYFIEIFFTIWIFAYLFKSYRKAEVEFKKQIIYFSLGVGLFLLSFSWANILGNVTANWEITQYGLFGMPVFLGFLGYLIVKYKAFNIKLLAAQALVVAIIILIASQFAFVRNPVNMVLTGITLAIVTIFGGWLIRSVKKVDEQREQLEVVNKELERLDKTKNEFINIASHQLRTPITVIRGVVSMIQQGDMDKLPAEARAKFYDGAMIKCNKLEEIINDILNATSLANNKFNVMDRKAEDIEVKKFFEDMVDSFKVETMERNINLSVGSLDESVPVIQGQRKYIEEAFTNLITNAIKYTPSSKATSEIRNTRDDSAEAKITISNKRDGDFVIFSVKDNGIGIPAEEIPHLFQKFFRAKNATAMYVDGTGLGLFIIKEVAQGHGGDVWVESEVGKGTEFFIKLPIKQTGKVDVKKFIEAQANLKM